MRNKSKILICIDWYFPGYKAGGPVRSCLNMVNHLKDDYDFYIVTGDTEYTETYPYPNIECNKWVRGPFNENVLYLSDENKTAGFYEKLFTDSKFEAIVLMGLFSKYFSILPLKIANKKNCHHIIVSPRGMLAPEALKIKSGKKKLFLSWVNLKQIYKNVTFHVSNETEQNQVQKNIKKYKKIIIADNFPRILPEFHAENFDKKINSIKLVSVARIAPEKNIKYALEVLMECEANVSFDIFGSIYNETYWKECKNVIEKLPKNISVQFHNSLDAEKLFDILPNYDLLFLPTLGENFGHIILESMMCGLPVLISDRTPWRNLESKGVGFDFSLENKSHFSLTIDCLSKESNEDYLQRRLAAFTFAKDKADTAELKKKYHTLFQ